MRLRKKKSLLDQASDYVDHVRPQVESAVATARDAVGDFVENTALPALADARDKAGPTLAEARDRAKPLVAAGAAKASEQASKAKEAADARVAQLRGEPPPKKTSRLRKIALFAALAGAAGFVFRKLRGDKETDNWESSYVPTPASGSPRTSPPPSTTPATDTGGSAPGEALADQVEEPRPVTTPDAPAEVVELDPADPIEPVDPNLGPDAAVTDPTHKKE